jgi:hypothetical protein
MFLKPKAVDLVEDHTDEDAVNYAENMWEDAVDNDYEDDLPF